MLFYKMSLLRKLSLKKQDRSFALESDLGRLIEAHSDPLGAMGKKKIRLLSPVEGDSIAA